MTAATEGKTSPTDRRGGALVGAAGTWQAVVGFVVLTIVVRTLPDEGAANFQIFWGTLFAVYGVLTGLQMEATRGVANAASLDTPAPGPQMGLVAAVAVGVIAAVGFGSMAGWHVLLNTASGANSWSLASAVVFGATFYSIQAVLVGTLTGLRRWRMTATVMAAEGTVRLALIVVVAVAITQVEWLAWASAVTTITALVIVAVSRQARQALGTRSDAHPGVLVRRIASAAAGQGTNALLVAGFSLLLSITSTAADMKAVGAQVMFAIQLTRAPLLVPLTALQGVAVSHFTRRRDAGVRAALPFLAAVAGIGVAGVGLAWLIGPWLFKLLSTREMSGAQLAGLTLGATMIGMLTLTGVLCQASARYQWYLAGWVTALVVAFAVLWTPYDMGTRAVAALITGPAVGMMVQLVGLRRRGGTSVMHDAAGTVDANEAAEGDA